jgi:folate-binding Fe-S cluster repair protein YgfZ/Flp pilus assembly protein TadD
MKFESLYDQMRLKGGLVNLAFAQIAIDGNDVEAFLQGQLSQDVKKISDSQQFLPAAILNAKGILEFHFILARQEQQFYLFCDPDIKNAMIERLNRFIVMEDVVVREMGSPRYFVVGVELIERLREEIPESIMIGNYWGDRVAVILDEQVIYQIQEIGYPTFSKNELYDYTTLNGFPVETFHAGQLVTNTLLMNSAVANQKGCFIGNETVAKIWNNRGAHKFPVWLTFDGEVDQTIANTFSEIVIANTNFSIIKAMHIADKSYILASLPREYRVESMKLEVEMVNIRFQVAVSNHPPFNNDPISKSQELCQRALHFFANNEETSTPEYLLKLAILTNPKNADAYESLGVLFARQEKFHDAIAMMQAWQEIDPENPMVHTNLSLYFMKVGNIHKAEEEKAMAVAKQFQASAKLAEEKNLAEKIANETREKMLQRMEMFQKVLAIDENDDIALNGLAEIYKEQGQIKKALELYEKVLSVNPNLSVAYLHLAEIHLVMSEKIKAKSILEQGIKVATHRGEMMPANKMQSLLNQMV